MANLATTYIGLSLANPVIVGSSSLTMDTESVKAAADAGAGAVVLKSIFEEQVREDFSRISDTMQDATYHPEAYGYFTADLATQYGAHDYCKTIEQMKGSVQTPVIASINCFSNATWNQFSKDVQNAGADAIELNLSFPPTSQLALGCDEHATLLAELVRSLKGNTDLPIAVKLPPIGGYVYGMAQKLVGAGADGLVLFNRFFAPKINIETMSVESGINFSSPLDASIPCRFIALLSRRLKADYCGSSGIHSAEEAIALTLVGANAVQVVSTVYQNGLNRIGEILAGLETWMTTQGVNSLEEVRGRLAVDPEAKDSPFGRFQYIKTLTNASSEGAGEK